MQKTWVPEFTPNLQKFTEIYATFCAIYKNLRNLQRKLDLAPGPTPIINRLDSEQYFRALYVTVRVFHPTNFVSTPKNFGRDG